jgi:hypothetical protein
LTAREIEVSASSPRVAPTRRSPSSSASPATPPPTTSPPSGPSWPHLAAPRR